MTFWETSWLETSKDSRCTGLLQIVVGTVVTTSAERVGCQHDRTGEEPNIVEKGGRSTPVFFSPSLVPADG